MTLTEHKLEALVRAAKHSSPYPAYIRWENGVAADTACKRCGNPLTQGGRQLPLYAEISIEFDDGSSHISPLCTSCRAKGLDGVALEEVYCDDMKALAIEEEATKTLMRWEMWKDRIPVGYRSL